MDPEITPALGISALEIENLSGMVDHRTMISSQEPSDKMWCQILFGSFLGSVTRSHFSRILLNPLALFPLS